MTTEGASQLVIRYPPSTSSTEALLEIVGSSHRLHTRNRESCAACKYKQLSSELPHQLCA